MRLILQYCLRLVYLLVICSAFGSVQAQSLETVRYTNEILLGVNFNTNAGFIGGASGQVSFKKSDYLYQFVGLEIVNVKHDQEQKVTNFGTGDNFIFGKQNYLFAIRPHVGFQKIVFPPAREEGVQVNLSLAAGPSIGFIKPYYIKYDYSRYGDLTLIREEAYDPSIHTNPNKITGNGSVLRGFGEAKLAGGMHLKGSVIFYFGNYGKHVSGLEAGGLLEAYVKGGPGRLEPNRINIIPFANNQWIFSSLFLNIFFGWRK